MSLSLFSLAGKIALVTGSGQGIGPVPRLAEHGVLQGNHGVRAEDTGLGAVARDQLGLGCGHAPGEGFGQLTGQHGFIDGRRHHRKAQSEPGKEVLPPGRGRGEYEGQAGGEHISGSGTRW